MSKVLLIGGGGTLGTYTAEELLKLGHKVDILCLEDKTSDDENLKFYKGEASLDYLTDFLNGNKYDGIVNYIHYEDIEDYKPIHKLLIESTKHLIVLSSYRVYADEQHPVTEQAPMLLDVSTDKEFVATEKYAISKAKLEKYLNSECKGQNWTVVRPVISFSKLRIDLVTYYGLLVLKKAKNNEIIPLPSKAKNVVAGFDWAGNSGKLIANLLFKEKTFGEAYTVSSAQNLTWGEVARIFTELTGAKFEWVSVEDYLKALNNVNYYPLIYDRLFDRTIDNSKILKVTGLTEKDFLSIKDGLKIEIELVNKEKII
ncbi:MAG: NAD-dependent epimerase/dehydratase family protein [Clostridia bacterium]|nr:NAD-dependent epimerase/dehydratase family protein [Clostridia bacterium]